MTKKTPTSERILRYIVSYTDEHGYAPTMREIATGVGLTSVGTVHRHIETLKEKGLLEETEQTSSRALVVSKQMRNFLGSDQQKCEHHICLRTLEGTSIILNCVSEHGNIKFNGAMYIQGAYSFAGNVVACRELSEPDYLSMIEKIGP